jgi:hypothetical protein
LKKAYRKKYAYQRLQLDCLVLTNVDRALRLHPDKGGDPELFKEVTHAYVFGMASVHIFISQD